MQNSFVCLVKLPRHQSTESIALDYNFIIKTRKPDKNTCKYIILSDYDLVKVMY